MELLRLWPERKKLTYSSFENTTAIINKVIYGVFHLMTHTLSTSAKLWRGLLGCGYKA